MTTTPGCGRMILQSRERDMFKMTLRRAYEIQAEQVEHYGRIYPGGVDALRAKVAEMTSAPGSVWARAIGLDTPIDVSDVNLHVPRGGCIERLCGIDSGAVGM